MKNAKRKSGPGVVLASIPKHERPAVVAFVAASAAAGRKISPIEAHRQLTQ